MNLKQNLNPKTLTIAGAIIWIIAKILGTENVIFSTLATLGVIIFFIGLVGLLSSVFKKQK